MKGQIVLAGATLILASSMIVDHLTLSQSLDAAYAREARYKKMVEELLVGNKSLSNSATSLKQSFDECAAIVRGRSL